jgi:hypothetical protein
LIDKIVKIITHENYNRKNSWEEENQKFNYFNNYQKPYVDKVNGPRIGE